MSTDTIDTPDTSKERQINSFRQLTNKYSAVKSTSKPFEVSKQYTRKTRK